MKYRTRTETDLSTPRQQGIQACLDGKDRETNYRGEWGRAWLDGWDEENARQQAGALEVRADRRLCMEARG